MPSFVLHNRETAPDASRATLDMVESRFGFVPNILRQMSEEPAALNAAVQLLGLVDQSSLDVKERWVVLLSVSSEIHSDYCLAANSAMATMSEVAPEIVEALRAGDPLRSDKLEALRTLVVEMVRERGQASRDTLQRFFDVGYSRAQLFAMLLGIATETLASYTDRITNVPLDDEFRPLPKEAR